MSVIIITVAFALAIAFILGTALGFFRDFFAVPQDPLTDEIRAVLPGANCGACGFPGCDNYAAAIVKGNAGIAACTVGGASVAEKIGNITGTAGVDVKRIAAVLACRGSKQHTALKGIYTGVTNCRGAKLSTGSIKLCAWGCLGFGDCVTVCKFGAMTLDAEKGLPVVDYAKCTGCQMCIKECPQGLLKAIPVDQRGAMALCSNRNPNKQGLIKTCKTACIKCGLCVKNCPQHCIDLSSHIPVVDLSKCDSCGTCVEKCPTKTFTLEKHSVFN